MFDVAIIEDDPATLARLRDVVNAANDMQVVAIANNLATARVMIESGGFDVLLCDLGLPDGDGVQLIKEAVRRYPDLDVLVVTIFANQTRVIDCIKAGARGYLLKDDGVEQCVENIRDLKMGGSPISPVVARQLLRQLAPNHNGVRNAADSEAQLSDRETDVLHLLARGFSYAEIAELLGLSGQTVGTYVKRLYRKLEVNSRSEAVFEAQSRGVIDVG